MLFLTHLNPENEDIHQLRSASLSDFKQRYSVIKRW